MDVKYNQGKIYEIISKEGNCRYIGSTIKSLDERLSKHKSHYKRFLDGSKHYLTCFDVLKYSDANIKLIEVFPCDTKEELLAREGYHMKEKDCVNKCIAGRTQREWNNENKEKVSLSKKKWENNNPDKKRKQVYEWRKNQGTESCICGGSYLNIKTSKERHMKTKKHLSFLQ